MIINSMLILCKAFRANNKPSYNYKNIRLLNVNTPLYVPTYRDLKIKIIVLNNYWNVTSQKQFNHGAVYWDFSRLFAASTSPYGWQGEIKYRLDICKVSH